MKKYLALMVTLEVGLATLSGCAGNTEKIGGGGDTDKTPGGGDTKYSYSMTMYQTRNSNPDSVMKKKIEEKYNIKLDVIDIEWQKYEEILNLKLAGGEVPDIIYVKTANSARKLVEQDIAGSISLDLLKEKAPNMLKRIEDSTGDILKYYYIDGELYTIPTFSASTGLSGIPLVWRGDWLEKVGINKLPETLDEYEEAFYKFATEDPDGNSVRDTYGLSLSGLTSIFASYGYVPALGATTKESAWQERDGKLVFAAIQPEMKTALARIAKWYADGILDPEFIIGENKGGYWAISHQFVNGIIGFTSHGASYHWEPLFFADSDPSSSGQDRYELLKIDPVAAEKLEVTAKVPTLVPGNEKVYEKPLLIKGERWMYSKELVEDKGKFERLLEIYNDMFENQENFDFVRNGEQGTVWTYDNVTAISGKTYKNKIFLNEWADTEYRNDQMFNFAPFSPLFLEEEVVKTPRDDWAEPRGFAKQYMPYTQLYAPLSSASLYKAELTKIEEEAYIDIITGEKPIEYFDEFVKKWREAGGKVLEEEANAWFNEVNSVKY